MRGVRVLAVLGALLITAACGGGGGDEDVSRPAPGGGQATAGATGGEEGGDGAAGGESILIGSLHPLTGALALDGTQMDQAAQLAVQRINDEGGIACLDGAQLEVTSADTRGEPEVGQSEAQRMIDEGAVALIGAFQSAVTTNIATTAERAQVPLVIDVAVDDAILDQGGTFTFRIQPNATAMGTYGAQYLASVAEAAGTPVETVAYLHEETNFGTSVFNAFQQEASRLGIEVVEEISYNAFSVTDLTTELTRVAASGADVLAVTGYYNDGLLIARNATAVRPDIVAIYGVAQGAYDLPQFPTDAPEASDRLFDSNYHFDATNPRTEEVRAAFQEETGEEMRTAAVLSYQAIEVIADALERACEADPAALRDAIAETSLADPLLAFAGPIEFDETGENVNGTPVVMQVQDGSIVQVYPEELAEAEPVFPGVPWAQ
jgi:branched-chain amino acid transport system substrate-binding protein